MVTFNRYNLETEARPTLSRGARWGIAYAVLLFLVSFFPAQFDLQLRAGLRNALVLVLMVPHGWMVLRLIHSRTALSRTSPAIRAAGRVLAVPLLGLFMSFQLVFGVSKVYTLLNGQPFAETVEARLQINKGGCAYQLVSERYPQLDCLTLEERLDYGEQARVVRVHGRRSPLGVLVLGVQLPG